MTQATIFSLCEQLRALVALSSTALPFNGAFAAVNFSHRDGALVAIHTHTTTEPWGSLVIAFGVSTNTDSTGTASFSSAGSKKNSSFVFDASRFAWNRYLYGVGYNNEK